MKTSHQLARELLELPDLPVYVIRWGEETPVPNVQEWDDGEVIALSPKS